MKQNWQYKKLGEVCDVRDGTHDSPNYILDGVPLITSKNIINGIIDFNNVNYISKIDANNINKRSKVDFGDIIMPMIGTIGNPVINTFDKDFCIKNVALIKFLEDSPLNKFVYYLLISPLFKNYSKKNNKGGTQKFLALGLIRDLIIPLPPLSEQERIVAELDMLSGIIEKQKQQLKELDTLAQSFFYSMFGDPITNDKNWEIKSIGEVGVIVGGSTPSTTDESNWDGDINWVTPAELDNQLFYGETQRKITQKAASKLTLMPIGTILLSSRAPIGKLAITTVPMCCNQGFKNIICGEEINNFFMYYLLSLTIEYIKALGRGATFKEVSKQSISNHKIIIPPLSLQNSFAEKIEKIEKQKEAINKSIAETQKLFDYTMDKYFG